MQRPSDEFNHLSWVTASMSGGGKRKEAEDPTWIFQFWLPFAIVCGELSAFSSDLGTAEPRTLNLQTRRLELI